MKRYFKLLLLTFLFICLFGVTGAKQVNAAACTSIQITRVGTTNSYSVNLQGCTGGYIDRLSIAVVDSSGNPATLLDGATFDAIAINAASGSVQTTVSLDGVVAGTYSIRVQSNFEGPLILSTQSVTITPAQQTPSAVCGQTGISPTAICEAGCPNVSQGTGGTNNNWCSCGEGSGKCCPAGSGRPACAAGATCNTSGNCNVLRVGIPAASLLVGDGQGSDCPAENVKTAIGCIPYGSTTALTTFLLRWGLGIAGGIAFLMIIYAGFLLMSSAGEPKRLQMGQELLTSAVAGLIMLIFSIFILRLIGVNVLGLF